MTNSTVVANISKGVKMTKIENIIGDVYKTCPTCLIGDLKIIEDLNFDDIDHDDILEAIVDEYGLAFHVFNTCTNCGWNSRPFHIKKNLIEWFNKKEVLTICENILKCDQLVEKCKHGAFHKCEYTCDSFPKGDRCKRFKCFSEDKIKRKRF